MHHNIGPVGALVERASLGIPRSRAGLPLTHSPLNELALAGRMSPATSWPFRRKVPASAEPIMPVEPEMSTFIGGNSPSYAASWA